MTFAETSKKFIDSWGEYCEIQSQAESLSRQLKRHRHTRAIIDFSPETHPSTLPVKEKPGPPVKKPPKLAKEKRRIGQEKSTLSEDQVRREFERDAEEARQREATAAKQKKAVKRANTFLHEQVIPLGNELVSEVTKSPGDFNMRMLLTFLHQLEANAEREQLERRWSRLLVELRAHSLRVTKGSRPRSKYGKTNTKHEEEQKILEEFERKHGPYAEKKHGSVKEFAKYKMLRSTMSKLLQRADKRREIDRKSAAENRKSTRER